MQDKRKDPYPIRMSERLRSYLQQKANEIGRSLHKEIIYRLEQSCRQEEQSK